MARVDENRFSIKPAAPKSRGGPRSRRFVSTVLKQMSKSGAKSSGKGGGRPAGTFGRGRVAATLAGQRLSPSARRVVIKSRFVVLRRSSPNSVAVHLRYIERDGVTREGRKGQAYGADTDRADLEAFRERGREDRHQFRFIVSAEDGLEIEDLQGFTRQLMARMEIDLETRLDWVAVDHWDTDNPHTHIVLNGRTSDGGDLVIAPDYMAHGMRMRASEIVTRWLGPRSELEMRRSLLREVDQQRLTSLDRALIKQAIGNDIDLTANPQDAHRQNALRARLQLLEAMGLAERVDANRWTLRPDMAATLDATGKREDALTTVRRALKGQQRECVVHDRLTVPVVGRIAGKGLADEVHDRGYLVVDAIDGRAHYLKLPAGADLAELPLHGIVQAMPSRMEKPMDRQILAATIDGIYRSAEQGARQHAKNHDAGSSVDAHVRRLEALRRAGIVARIADGVWKVPPDLLRKIQQHDAQKDVGLIVEVRSHLPIEQQVRTVGATWLDRQLVGDGAQLAAQGFGLQVREAMHGRVDVLVDHGLAERRGRQVLLVRDLLAKLRDRELRTVGNALQTRTGQTYRHVHDRGQVSGVYRRSLQLGSGRFAVLDDGAGFSLVPWRPVIENRFGQEVSATIHRHSVTWHLGRQPGIGV